MGTESSPKPATVCIHGGYRATRNSPAIVAPIVQSSTFLLDDRAYALMTQGRSEDALIYTRVRNPSLDVVQERLASLEGAERALLFGSGMAAMHAALLSLLSSGSRIVVHHEIYGSTWDLIANQLSELGIASEFCNLNDTRERRAALARGAQAVLCESISNPTLVVADLPAIAQDAKDAGAPLVVDATFASPILQRPLTLGAQLVVHSATKYLGGHSDLLGGVVCGPRAELDKVFRWLQLAGGVLDPHAAFLLDRGLKTLPLRMRAHSENALVLAKWLAQRPEVDRVLYPGLTSHPSYALAQDLLDQSGGMLSFIVKGGDAIALSFARALKLALEASSLGGVETLVSLPFNTSHARLTPEQRLAVGIPPGFVRVSVGIEDVDDVIFDFQQALATSAG